MAVSGISFSQELLRLRPGFLLLRYGGLVGFKMAEVYPELVESMVVTCSVIALTELISRAYHLGFKSWADYLLPDSVKGVETPFKLLQ
ncbi:hypothetical protein F3Y22_tig00112114pilonHSYRG00140 [Hibiscus syriacus]|uniref:Uncharacterized protein n=1 Tax=Hibiscus syriacus TaxID=106335 RepID=A0A6A2XV23_HIBSY|nr:hypothetical protein F3Y22_tig00112114pilonHSYRG00140 [Hibiscus syriacus]